MILVKFPLSERGLQPKDGSYFKFLFILIVKSASLTLTSSKFERIQNILSDICEADSYI